MIVNDCKRTKIKKKTAQGSYREKLYIKLWKRVQNCSKRYILNIRVTLLMSTNFYFCKNKKS